MSSEDITRLVYIAYIVAMILVYGAVVWDDWRAWSDDQRDNAEDLLSDLAMLVSAFAGAGTLFVVLTGVSFSGLRAALFGLFLGGFLAAGIVRLTLRRRRGIRDRHSR